MRSRHSCLALVLTVGLGSSCGKSKDGRPSSDVSPAASPFADGQPSARPSSGNGNEVGNGGDVVECTTGDQKTDEVLDITEAKMLWQLAPKLDCGTKAVDKATCVIDRLNSLDPTRSRKWHDGVNTFMAKAQFLDHVELSPVNDTDNLALPINCVLRQTVIQHVPEFPEDKIYTVNKDIWDLLDADNQAALMLHEVIYHEAIQMDQTDSHKSRYFNAHLMADAFKSQTLPGYLTFLALVAFDPVIEVGANAYQLGTLEYGSNGKLKSGAVSEYDKFPNEEPLSDGYFTFGSGQSFGSFPGKPVTFYETGALKHIFAWGGNYKIDDSCTLTGIGEATLTIDGTLASAALDQFASICISVNGKLLVPRLPFVTGYADFYPNGVIKSVTLSADVTLLTTTGGDKTYHAGTKVSFDETGRALP